MLIGMCILVSSVAYLNFLNIFFVVYGVVCLVVYMYKLFLVFCFTACGRNWLVNNQRGLFVGHC